jgi:O-antigen/teichoic acid export membrane protein
MGPSTEPPAATPPSADSHDLSRKVRSAYVWTFGGNAVRQLLAFTLSMLLARFLSPSDYGLVGMVLVFTTFLAALQDMGFGRAVIFFRDSDASLPTFYTIATAAGAFLAGCLFTAAPFIATFYNSPQLAPIVRCLSITLLFGGMRSVSQSLMTKHLLFRRLTIIEGICGLTSAAVAVYLAWRGYGAWSLVTNLVLASTLQTIVVLTAIRPKYTFTPDWAVVKKTLRWGTPMLGSSVLWKLYDNADYLIIGKLAGKESLGFYTVAFRLATLVNEKIGGVVSRVSFPTFAALQHDRSRVAGHWFSITRKSALISFPVLTILIAGAEDIIGVILGQKWLPSVHLLRLLCVVGALRVLTPVTINLLPALGRPDLAFRYTLMNAILMPASFFVACRWNGTTGVAWAWLLVFPLIACRTTIRIFSRSRWTIPT